MVALSALSDGLEFENSCDRRLCR